MIMISQNPRQIAARCVCDKRTEEEIQRMVDSIADGEKYYVDGYSGYRNVVFPGVHIRNCRDKSGTQML
jgi:hypothetical protein